MEVTLICLMALTQVSKLPVTDSVNAGGAVTVTETATLGLSQIPEISAT